MHFIGNTKAMVLMVFMAISGLFTLGFSDEVQADAWWNEVKKCVSAKEEAKKKSGEWVDSWMFEEWERECADATPDIAPTPAGDLEFNILYERKYIQLFGIYANIIQLVSYNDHVVITGVELNRGNCEFANALTKDVDPFPVTLGYGQAQIIYPTCDIALLRELKINTEQGSLTYELNMSGSKF